MFIDIHSHQQNNTQPGDLTLVNCMVSKDYLNQFPASAGIHPWYIDDNFQVQMEALELYLAKDGVLAVGECGLDKNISADFQKQIMAFEKQIELANQLGKPLIIHCVRAYSEVFSCLLKKKVQVPVIFHGFSKKWVLAEQLLKHGFYISLGPQILKSEMDELISHIPLDKLFLETDDKSFKISDIYAYFCRARNLSQSQLQEQIMLNFSQIFNYIF